MDDANFLPDDLAACQRLLLAAFQQSVELERQVADAKRQAADAKQQATELSRVLDETAASYQELQQEHAATLDELAWYRRWTFGRRRERIAAGAGQGHLFELDSPLSDELPASTTPDPEAGNEVKARRRRKRQIDWDQLPQVRHDHDLDDHEKICSCCGRPMKCIGEDVTRELEYQPAKLEAHIHVRPKYACP
ncbi:MAG: IS66 family transposase zinc-finger binding domain-containing protein, partial [Terriglobales bacterium]